MKLTKEKSGRYNLHMTKDELVLLGAVTEGCWLLLNAEIRKLLANPDKEGRVACE